MAAYTSVLPFDLDVYRVDPKRLCSISGYSPIWAQEVYGHMVVQWRDAASPALHSAPWCHLRLAPLKPEMVTVRLFSSTDGGSFPGAIVTKAGAIPCPLLRGNCWISDSVEIALYPRSGK